MSGCRYAPHPAVSAMEIDREVTLYHRDSRAAVMLNDSASAIWRLLDGARTVNDIVEALVDRYQANPETIATDVEDVLEKLTSNGLIEATQ